LTLFTTQACLVDRRNPTFTTAGCHASFDSQKSVKGEQISAFLVKQACPKFSSTNSRGTVVHSLHGVATGDFCAPFNKTVVMSRREVDEEYRY
jgi:hypothetical protein